MLHVICRLLILNSCEYNKAITCIFSPHTQNRSHEHLHRYSLLALTLSIQYLYQLQVYNIPGFNHVTMNVSGLWIIAKRLPLNHSTLLMYVSQQYCSPNLV